MRIVLSTGTPADLVRPPTPPIRGLVLCPDVMGLRPLFDAMAERLAAENAWTVCAVEPFPGHEHCTIEERLALMPAENDEDHLADLVEAADRTGVEPVGVLGFCMGGMFALKAAGTGRFDRAVSFYGMIRTPPDWRSDTLRDPLGYVERRGATRVLELVGGRDALVPADDVEALKATGVSVVEYPEAEHGFVHDPARPAHRPGDAANAWRRAITFLSG